MEINETALMISQMLMILDYLVMQFAPVIFTGCDRICHSPMLNWLQFYKKEASYDQFHHDRGFSKKPG
jgi:hypothetical protein